MPVEQLSVRNVSDRIGRVGQVISPAHMNDERNYPITEGRADQVLHVDVAAGGSGDQTVTVLGEPVTITATGTQATDVTALKDALNDNPIVRGIYTATETGSATVILTANDTFTDLSISGGDPDVTVSGDALTLSEDTAQSDATQIDVARAVYFDGSGGVTVTNPNSGDLEELAGFTKHFYDAEQTSIASGDTDLYEDQEDVIVMKTARMIVDTGDDATENDPIWIEQTAGDNLGKAYNSSGSSAHTLTVTPTAANDTDYQLVITVDDQVVVAEYTSDGTATVAEITAGLTAELDANTQASLLTTTDNGTDFVVTITDSDADVAFVADDNLSVAQDDGTTRLKLPKSLGRWAGPNKIEFRLAL